MTKWTTIDIAASESAAAELVLAHVGESEAIGAPESCARASAAIRNCGFDARMGRWLDLVGEAGAPRLLVLGLGAGGPGSGDWRALGGHLVDAMQALRLTGVRLPAAGIVGADALEMLIEGALLHGFRLDQGRKTPRADLPAGMLVVQPSDEPIAQRAIRAAGPINRARAWVEQPANLLTPTAFAAEAIAALEPCGVKTAVLGRADLERIGAGALLAVARASVHEPQLVLAEWRGDPARPEWDAAFVGKGLTFDSGGLNLKARPVIEKMKLDMGGAAAVLGALELAAIRGARANIVAVVPMAENAIGQDGYRPGDVIRSLSGLTIEVLNTDAEGRLVLADAITYAIDTYAPARVIDVATLTGLITGVLHEEYAGLYASDDALADGLLTAGEATGEHLWRLPLSPRQDYIVDSTVADVANLGNAGFLGAGGGSPTAGAKFIERFATGTAWAHVDIAGTAWATRRTPRSGPGATGFGVALLDRWIAGLAEGSAS